MSRHRDVRAMNYSDGKPNIQLIHVFEVMSQYLFSKREYIPHAQFRLKKLKKISSQNTTAMTTSMGIPSRMTTAFPRVVSVFYIRYDGGERASETYSITLFCRFVIHQ